MRQTSICKHRVAAVAIAAGGALALATGTAVADTSTSGHDHIRQRGESGASGFADVTQHSGVFSLSLGLSNSGLNHAGNSIDQSNGTGQGCDANTKGGNVLAIGGIFHASDTDVNAGNQGGNCSNDASSANTANPTVSLTTGNASATNGTSTTVNQNNSGGVDVSSSNDGSIDPSGAANHIRQSGGSWADGELSVDQSSKVGNVSIGIANSGGNSAGNHISQSNGTDQGASANTKGGNVLAIGGGDVSTGNNGGTASNKSSSSNTANPSVTLTTGNASASNSTTTNVTQTNSGGVHVSSSNNGSIG